MELMAALAAFHALERRGVEFYRTLAERFRGTKDERLWRECLNAEAGHQTIFGLALDWAQLSSDPKPDVPIDPADLAREGEGLDALLREAARPDLSPAAAVELALSWEERELPRVLFIAPRCPGRGRTELTAMVAEASRHYDDLDALARTTGDASLLSRVAALRAQAHQATG